MPRRRRNPAPTGRSLALLGARIRTLRKKAGFTQAELGQPHLTRAAVSRIELGHSGVAFKTLVFVARRLRVRVRDVIPPQL